jgi:CheY-like chemotaxis protein
MNPRATDAEQQSIAAVRALEILDTPSEAILDNYVRIAAAAAGTDIAALILLGADRLWLKASVGVDVTQVERGRALCEAVIGGGASLWVADAAVDPRFYEAPFVAKAPFIRFYAGAPIVVDGQAVGSLCVSGKAARSYEPRVEAVLRQIAEAVAIYLVERRDRLGRPQPVDAGGHGREAILADLSHEIRTPLNGIVAVAELLARQTLDPYATKLVETIGDSAGALERALSVLPGETAQGPDREAGVDVGAARRILIVDDHATNRAVAEMILGAGGFCTAMAEDGAAALEALAQSEFDAVLMDMQMPVLDGLAATRELRRREAGAHHTPIVMVTANVQPEHRQAALEAGADAFVTKPVRPAVLLEALSSLLDETSSTAAKPLPGAGE